MIHPNLNAYGISTIWGTFINHISNEREKFQVFNGVHQLSLIMNTNVLFTNKMATSAQKPCCVHTFSKFTVSKKRKARTTLRWDIAQKTLTFSEYRAHSMIS